MTTENPYRSPIHAESGRADTSTVLARRPIGIWILSGFYGLTALAMLAAAALLAVTRDSNETLLQMPGATQTHIFLSLGVSLILSSALTVGLWLGGRWAWWLAGFNCTYSIVTHLVAIADVLVSPEVMAYLQSATTSHFLKHGVRIAVQGLVLLYLFKHNVREFFSLPRLKIGRTAAIFFVLAAALVGILKLLRG